MGRLSQTLTFALVVAIGLACATGNEPSGFLGDYAQLEKGRGNQARLVYFHLEADFSAYDAIIVDPVVVWDAEKAGPSLDPTEEAKRQADYFRQALRERLAEVYQLVEVSNPRTLRLRMAIIDGLSGVNIECELIDSVSRERLVAAVDHRKLSAVPAAADAKRVYDQWALIIRNRLVALRDFDASLNDGNAAATD
jgi:hypothetical protein